MGLHCSTVGELKYTVITRISFQKGKHIQNTSVIVCSLCSAETDQVPKSCSNKHNLQTQVQCCEETVTADYPLGEFEVLKYFLDILVANGERQERDQLC